MSHKEEPLPAKKEVVLALLESADVFVHLDPRGEDVRVPKWFKNQPHLVLQIGLNMPVPIKDLEVTEDAVSCTLSFNRSPFFCFIPWRAVYALVGSDNRAMVWPEDIPPEVAAQAAKAAAAAEAQAERRMKLRPVKSEGEAEAEKQEPAPEEQPAAAEASPPPDASSPRATPSEPPEKGKRPLPPYLRVVK